MGSVFINYRRDETAGEARALFNDLAATLGPDSVFMDVDNIALGRDFRHALQERLGSCDLMLVLIGRRWVDAKNAAGHRRLDDPNDYVRFEIVAALKRNIPVLPVLVQGAHVPAIEQLPDDIRDLAYRNAFELSHTRWESDVHEMLKRLGLSARRETASAEHGTPAAVAQPGMPAAEPHPKAPPVPMAESRGVPDATPRSSSRLLMSIAAASGAVALAGGGWLYNRTIVEQNARIEQARVESAKAKADAEAQVNAAKADAATARAIAEAEAAKAALAAAYAERDRSAAQAAKERAAALTAERDRAAQSAKDKAAAQAESERAAAQAAKEKAAAAQSERDRAAAQAAKDKTGSAQTEPGERQVRHRVRAARPKRQPRPRTRSSCCAPRRLKRAMGSRAITRKPLASTKRPPSREMRWRRQRSPGCTRAVAGFPRTRRRR